MEMAQIMMFQIAKWPHARLIYSKILSYLFIISMFIALIITLYTPLLFRIFATDEYTPGMADCAMNAIAGVECRIERHRVAKIVARRAAGILEKNRACIYCGIPAGPRPGAGAHDNQRTKQPENSPDV